MRVQQCTTLIGPHTVDNMTDFESLRETLRFFPGVSRSPRGNDQLRGWVCRATREGS